MSARASLPNRRRQISCEFIHGGIGWTVSAGVYEDGPIGEVFLHCHKTSSTIEALGRDAAILASIALQYGAPLDVMRHALTRAEDGGPATLAGAMLDHLVEHLQVPA